MYSCKVNFTVPVKLCTEKLQNLADDSLKLHH